MASGTVIAEDYGPPELPQDVQVIRQGRGQSSLPSLAIVTKSLRIDPQHHVFSSHARPLIITSHNSDSESRKKLEEVADIIIAGDEEVDLETALVQLGNDGARVVLLEGGPSLNGAFVDAGLIDEMCLTVAPFLLGGESPRQFEA